MVAQKCCELGGPGAGAELTEWLFYGCANKR